MQSVEVEALSITVNAAVIRMPGRKFPGIVIQGDSMKIIVDWVREIADLSRDCNIPELREPIDELMNLVSGHLRNYELALEEHGQPLPYERNPMR
jgi:hypothetical protein